MGWKDLDHVLFCGGSPGSLTRGLELDIGKLRSQKHDISFQKGGCKIKLQTPLNTRIIDSVMALVLQGLIFLSPMFCLEDDVMTSFLPHCSEPLFHSYGLPFK